jgi:chaperonin cofactor prefoldin
MMQTGDSLLPLLGQKVDSIEKQLDNLDKSHAILVKQITELITTVNLRNEFLENKVSVLSRNHQNLNNKLWGLVAVVLASLLVSVFDMLKR